MSILLNRNFAKFLVYDIKHNLSTVSHLLAYAKVVCQGKSLRKLTPRSIISKLNLEIFARRPDNVIAIDSYRSLLAGLLYSILAKDVVDYTLDFQNDRLKWCFNRLSNDDVLMSVLTKSVNASLQSPNLVASLNIDLVSQAGKLGPKLSTKFASSFASNLLYEPIEITLEIRDALLTLVNAGFGFYIVVCKDYMQVLQSSNLEVVIAESCGKPVPEMQTLIDLLKLHSV